MQELNKRTEHVHFEIFTQRGILQAFQEDLQDDIKVITLAVILIAIYTTMVLGAFSAIHFRGIVTIVGLACIAISFFSGFGLCYYLGGTTAQVHQLMQFLLVGIGADDMFVICNAVDQTDLKAPAA